jgi:hypothetical protein
MDEVFKGWDQVQLRPPNIEATIHHFQEDIHGIQCQADPSEVSPSWFANGKMLPLNE